MCKIGLLYFSTLQAFSEGAVTLNSIDLLARKHWDSLWPTRLQLLQCVRLFLSLGRKALICFPSHQITRILPQHQFQRLPWYVTGSYNELPSEFVHWLGKEQNNPITGLDRPRGFQEVEASRFQDNWQMKMVRLSVLRTGRFYPTGNIPGTHFC